MDGLVIIQDFKGVEGGWLRMSLKLEERFEKFIDKMFGMIVYNEVYNCKKFFECLYIDWVSKYLVKKVLVIV